MAQIFNQFFPQSASLSGTLITYIYIPHDVDMLAEITHRSIMLEFLSSLG